VEIYIAALATCIGRKDIENLTKTTKIGKNDIGTHHSIVEGRFERETMYGRKGAVKQ